MSYNNIDEHRWSGYWWLPGSEEKHPGVLEYSPDSGFVLSLLTEGFESPYIELDIPTKRIQGGGGLVLGHRNASYDAVYGAADGRYMTAFNVQFRKANQKVASQASFGESIYGVHSLLIGAHVTGLSEACVEKAYVSIDNLHRWIGGSSRLSVYTEIFENNQIDRKSRIDFQHKVVPGPQRGAVLTDETVISFQWNATLPLLRWSSQSYEAKITESPFVAFKPSDPWTLEDVQEHSSAMARLVSLGLDKPCAPFSIELILVGNGNSSTGHYLSRRGNGEHNETFVHQYEAHQFTLREIDAESLIPAWFGFHERYRIVLGLYYTMHSDSPEQLETSVLLSAVLAESFHKFYFGNKASDVSDAAVELAETLFEGPRYKRHAGSFRERILDLYCRAPKELVEELIPNVGQWSKLLVETRNSIAHEGGLQEKIYESAFAISRVTFVLVSIHLLIAIGISKEVIDENMRESKLFKSAVFMTHKYLLKAADDA